MACTLLTKSTRTDTVHGLSGTPGSPEILATPARTVSTPHEVCEWSPSAASIVVCEASESVAFGPDTACILLGDPLFTRECHTEYTIETIPGTAYVPAVPATPPTEDEITVLYNEGWNSHSRSVLPVLVGQQIKFTVLPGSRAVFVGMAPAGNDGLSPGAFTYGLRIDASGVTVVEGGRDIRILASTFFSTTEFIIARTASNRIGYIVVGLTGYTSTIVPPPLALYAYGMLYRGLDQVTCAEIESTTVVGTPTGVNQTYRFTAKVTGKPWAVINSAYTMHAVGTLTYATLSGDIDEFSGLMSDAAYSDMSGDLGTFTCQMNGGFAVPPSIITIYGNVDHFAMSMTGLTGGVGSISESIDTYAGLMWGYAGGGSMSGNIDTFMMYAENLGEEDTAQIFTMVELSALMTGLRDLNATCTAEIGLVSTTSVVKAQVANIVSTVLLSSTSSVSAEYIGTVLGEVLVSNLWSVGQGDELPTDGHAPSVFAVNLDTGATSEYTNYGFSDLHEGQGLASDGVYTLGGADTDDGNLIDAIVEMGSQQYDSHKKSVHNLYAAALSGGKLLVKVEVDGVEWVYEARNFADDTTNKRFDIGKGLKGNYWKFTLLNQDGDDFEIASANFTPLTHGRRI